MDQMTTIFITAVSSLISALGGAAAGRGRARRADTEPPAAEPDAPQDTPTRYLRAIRQDKVLTEVAAMRAEVAALKAAVALLSESSKQDAIRVAGAIDQTGAALEVWRGEAMRSVRATIREELRAFREELRALRKEGPP